MNLHGEHEGPCGKTMATFKDCMMLFLKTVFANHVAEGMKFYMTCLKNEIGLRFAGFYSERQCKMVTSQGSQVRITCGMPLKLRRKLYLTTTLILRQICCMTCPRRGSNSTIWGIKHQPM
jgi:hypothetical protein